MDYLSFFFSLRALRMLVEYNVKVSNHVTRFSARNGELSVIVHYA